MHYTLQSLMLIQLLLIYWLDSQTLPSARTSPGNWDAWHLVGEVGAVRCARFGPTWTKHNLIRSNYRAVQTICPSPPRAPARPQSRDAPTRSGASVHCLSLPALVIVFVSPHLLSRPRGWDRPRFHLSFCSPSFVFCFLFSFRPQIAARMTSRSTEGAPETTPPNHRFGPKIRSQILQVLR